MLIENKKALDIRFYKTTKKRKWMTIFVLQKNFMIAISQYKIHFPINFLLTFALSNIVIANTQTKVRFTILSYSIAIIGTNIVQNTCLTLSVASIPQSVLTCGDNFHDGGCARVDGFFSRGCVEIVNVLLCDTSRMAHNVCW